uniref:NADH-ubiquinone oxidoreductase chain 3 n=1 Tax=Leptomyrmex pallens TaxID=611136 RepID=V5JF26_9HYME|nr:NADH dehydrogenase subunit 3 [Leptomyrmex pallens]AGL61397.1 NADH dehydrogenase subunit 3 [Leptomyrmex pallens]
MISSIIILSSIFALIILTLLLLNLTLSKKSQMSREKSSPFECGFDPMNNKRIPYSNQFFMISLMFLIFDIEITLLIPLIVLMSPLNQPMMFSTMLFFLFLVLGLYLEYMEASLDWKF